MPRHRPAGGFSTFFSPEVAVADPDTALALLQGEGELAAGRWVPCVCVPTWCYLVGIRQVPGDTEGLELHRQLPPDSLLLGRLVWGGKASTAAVLWGARGQAEVPCKAGASLSLTEHCCGARVGACSEENRAPHYREGDL